MSFGFKHAKAQYNYQPDRTRPVGPGDIRSPDPKRPMPKGHHPGKPVKGPSAKRPKRI